MFELSPAGLIVVDADGRIVLVNRELERIFGYARSDLIGLEVERLVPETLRGRHPDFRAAYLGAPQARPMGAGRELRGLRRDGTEVPIEIGLAPVHTDRATFVLASVIDQSARRRADERFEAAVESAPSAMAMVDARGTIVLVNRETERVFGYTRDELIGRPIEQLVPGAVQASHVQLREAYFAEPTARPMGAGRELHGRRRDGVEIPVEIGLNPIRTEDGMYVLSSIVDVSARREAERALVASEERLRLMVEQVEDVAIFMLDAQGRVSSWNAGAQRIKGYQESEILGQTCEVFFPDDDRRAGRPAEILRRAAAEGSHEEEGWRVRKDGTRFLASTVTSALRGPDGQLRGFVKLNRDVTERRQLEDRQRQSQKLEAIGTLAGGIAHDFNNILLGIVGFSELAQAAVADRPQVHSDIGRVLAAAERGRQLVQRILTFSRRNEPIYAPRLLEGPVREAVHLLRASLPRTTEIRVFYDPETPPVLTDETQIHQILMNLATNASHAIGDRVGVVEVSTGPCLLGADAQRTHPGVRPGLYARLVISDDGDGMPPEVVERALEPFFTTKATGSGSGLGLSVVHGIVQSHGGSLTLDSRPGEGTRIEILLPAAEGLPLAGGAESPEPVATPRRHVLLVEDEEILAELRQRQIESLGHRVTKHTSSLAALEDFRSRPQAFDLVITDNSMPHMTGVQLAHEILALRPAAKILMVSGMADTMAPEDVAAYGIARLLVKPHTLPQLAQAVSELLATGPKAERP